MKTKGLMLTLLVLLPSLSFGQEIYRSFLEENKIWTYHYYNSFTGKEFYESLKVSGDTVIGGMSYKKVVDVATGNYKYGMREDGRKVYCIYANDKPNGEKLIYDFGLNVGDTFKLYDADETVDPSSRATVVSVDTIVVGNRAFRVMDVRPNDQSGSSNWWVEGIGSMYGIECNFLSLGNNYTFSYCQINGETILTHKDVRSVKPYTGDVSNSGCMNKTRGESELGNMLIKLTREGRNLIGEVTNYLVNCAYDDVRVSCEQKGQDLYIYVSEIAREYADCMCPINIYFTIFNASKSQYGLYLNGKNLGQVSFADHSVVQIDSETLNQTMVYSYDPLYFEIEKIDHTVGVPPVLKTPPSAPTVLVNGNVLEFQGEHPAYTLNIVDNEGNTLFTTEVSESMMQVELPFNLTKDMEVNLLQGSWRIYGRLEPDHETVKVNGINNHPASPFAPVYDLQGRRIQGEPQKGVYLRNGRKYVRK